MQDFDYTVVDESGKRQRSTLRASGEAEALRVLYERRLQVISISLKRGRSPSRQGGRALDAPAVASLVEELATLLEAGVPLAEALDTLAQPLGTDHPLARVMAAVRGGESFSSAMDGSGLGLQPFVLQLLRAGESTGQLAKALRSAASHLVAELDFAREARNALLYPMVLVGSGVLATLVMFVFVVPRFAGILSNPKADLPLLSQWVLGMGLWLTQHQMALGLGLGALAALGVWAFGKAEVRQWAWELVSKMPLLGRWAWHAEVGRWASLLAVLLQSRVPLLSALAQANETFRRHLLRSQGALVLAGVRGGQTLSAALAEHALLDGPGLNLIRVGERAGSLPQTVLSLARIHTQQSQQRLKRFLVLLEPLTILLISVVLGGIMISVMLAITSLTNVL
jgi:general secretion pathway protein F